MGISLWLVPPRDVAAKLRVIMDMKTASYRSPSSFPHFEPHVTLCTVPSSTEISELCSAIPKDQSVVPVTFKAVEVGPIYFMSVYATVHHKGELNALREALKAKLGEKAIPPVSHVSLHYIDDSEPEERTKLFDQLREEGRIVDLGKDSVALDCSLISPAANSSQAKDLVSEFAGGEIWVAVCDGPVPTWKISEKIALHSP
ncbi:hypothetical protein NM688_g5328 [Phlebia brevispora]|uniref:Uncharacterized protein n=1 Tax=Phlebia brevispora TaxID=194682 RepID=A0ACC1SX37_9APHY|nr:hypothetical protein NM688_g5328 [Phlebia brevispora]